MSTARPIARAARAATRDELLEAARRGGLVAAADRAGRPSDAGRAYVSWRRLRRRVGGPARRLLRVAFDTGYGRAMQGAHPTPEPPSRSAGAGWARPTPTLREARR